MESGTAVNQIQKLHCLQRENVWSNNPTWEEIKRQYELWLNEETVDYWRHSRMYETIRPIAAFFQNKKWLTIGDGNCGFDAWSLKRKFNLDVFPTDLSGKCISWGNKLGIIREYGEENAENLSFQDNSFDIVFCKESFHHFPRPYLAIYEMLRVARVAVVIIEANDVCVLKHPRDVYRQFIKMFLNLLFPKNEFFQKGCSFFTEIRQSFEESGNFVFLPSKRELTKIAIGSGLGGFAWKGFNDQYISGCEFEKAEENNKMFKKIRTTVSYLDKQCRRYPLFNDWGFCTQVLFKKEVDEKLRSKLNDFDYEFVALKKNPLL